MIRTFQALLILFAMGGAAAAHSAAPQASDCSSRNADPKAAVAACSQTIDSARSDKPTLLSAHFERGLRYLQLAMPERQRGDCDAMVGLAPDDPRGYDCRGMMFGALKQYDPAISNFSQAIQLDARDVIALLGRGTALQLKGDFAGAIPDYDGAIKLNPADVIALNNRCWSRAVQGRDLDAALADCNEAIRLDPAGANNYNSRAFVQFRLKHYSEAIHDSDVAINRDGRDGTSFYIRGLAKRALGDRAGGRADIAIAKSLDPTVAQVYRGYGIRAVGE